MATLQTVKFSFLMHINKTTNATKYFLKKTRFMEAIRSNKTIYRDCHSFSSVEIPKKFQSTALNIGVASEEERNEFVNYFPQIVKDVTDISKNTQIPDLANSLKILTEYNVPYSKKTRGLGTVLTYKLIEHPDKLTPDNIRLANILGWCTEMLHAYLILFDDIMDRADIRHNAPCWYKLDNVKEAALNDGIILENSLFKILRKYYRNHPCYVQLMELFHDTSLNTSFGQKFDLQICGLDKPRLDLFTMEHYRTMGYYKTGYYSFYLPVLAAMYLAQVADEKLHRQALDILLEIGHLYQVQNDYFDCFGDSVRLGKESYSDIREGKCSWLAVVALQNATPEQRAIMERCYGHSDDESVQAVINLYKEQDLPNKYLLEEEALHKHIRQQIAQVSNQLPKEIFYNFLKMIYNIR